MTTLFAPSALVSFPKSKSCNRIHVGVSASSSSSSSSSSRLSLTKTKVSELGFVTSQLGGLKISNDHSLPLKSLSFASPQPVLQPIIARRICRFTGKRFNRANKVSFSNHKTKKVQFVNLQYKRVWWEAGKRFLDLRLSTNALRTIDKIGLDALAKRAGIDLRKE
ncbi:hypothetical protein MRB53_003780 [Persea americana]|uniref:Uncharacterized protein n=1 Tax=Persea americana TaxID=3435 RepID=A0ACC2MY71_PERAE|nr:hypothetical protein MRB53_003780 [Persea americana]